MIESKAQLKRPALGRGLGALIPGATPAERKGVINVPIEEVVTQRGQPRRHFDGTERHLHRGSSYTNHGDVQRGSQCHGHAAARP